MPLVINTNVASLNAQRNLNRNALGLVRVFERLASGSKINHAKDNAAGLQISEGLESQIRGVSQAMLNVQDGYSLLGVAEGALMTMMDHFQRIRELVIQAANETYGPDQRSAMALEIEDRTNEIDRIAVATQFNQMQVFANRPSFILQVGPNNNPSNVIDIATALEAATCTDMGMEVDPFVPSDIDNNTECMLFLGDLDSTMQELGRRLSVIGSFQNRLDSTLSNLEITYENLKASQSRIRDADIANEASQLMRYQILQQASSSILNQANVSSEIALSLIRT